jgi:hypothetical protein
VKIFARGASQISSGSVPSLMGFSVKSIHSKGCVRTMVQAPGQRQNLSRQFLPKASNMVTFGNATTPILFCLRFKNSVPNIHRKLASGDAVQICTDEEKRGVLPSAVSSKSPAGIVPERKLSANSSMPKTSKVIREIYYGQE